MTAPSSALDASRVTLRPLAIDDAETTYTWLTQADLCRDLGLQSEPTLPKTRAWIEHAQHSHDCRAFAVDHGGVHVGNLVLDRITHLTRTARLSLYIGDPACRGKSIGFHAIRLALEEAFMKLALHKVWLIVHVNNRRAIRLYERCGFLYEGILRDEFLCDGQRVDAYLMAILRPEYDARANDS